MTSLDDQNEGVRSGKSSTSMTIGSDPRMSSLINWVWAALGAVGIMIGIGVYNKLSSMNDTLIIAVSKLENQAQQISDIRGELSRQRDELAALRSQVSQIEGRTLRGIQEAVRGH